jgi:hypothetical protein
MKAAAVMTEMLGVREASKDECLVSGSGRVAVIALADGDVMTGSDCGIVRNVILLVAQSINGL